MERSGCQIGRYVAPSSDAQSVRAGASAAQIAGSAWDLRCRLWRSQPVEAEVLHPYESEPSRRNRGVLPPTSRPGFRVSGSGAVDPNSSPLVVDGIGDSMLCDRLDEFCDGGLVTATVTGARPCSSSTRAAAPLPDARTSRPVGSWSTTLVHDRRHHPEAAVCP
jgi:hypothetical protein